MICDRFWNELGNPDVTRERPMTKQIVEKIRNAGVVGAGGAGLPTHIKADAAVDTVLVNGASCEPLLLSDPHLMETETDTLLKGLETMLDCTGATKGIVCLKSKHAKALEAVKAALSKRASGRLDFFELDDFYPAGDEHVLVNEVLGRTVPERGIPLQVGAVVANVETLCNVARAMDDVPVTHRLLTVAGEIRRPMIVKVPVGTPVMDILAFAGGPTVANWKVVDGGPMMGQVLTDVDRASVKKTTSGLLVLPPEHTVVAGKIMDPAKVRRITNTVCCQCSLCTDLCPRRLLGHSLHPHKLMRVPESQTLASPVAREALLCSECGICEKFACPMLISPREVNAQIKQRLMKEGLRWESSGTPPAPSPFRKSHHVPSKRLLQRLNLIQYDTHPGYAGEFTPPLLRVSMRQHLGTPANCLVVAGNKVNRGDPIGEIPENTMSARIHAGISGTVESVTDGVVTIRA